MDSAKEAVKNFIHKSGRHDTEVHEQVNPSVTEEHVRPHRHEESTVATDREVHQHHYHTTVQPLEHKEVMPEKHTHQQMPVEHREFHHGDHEKVKAGVSREAAQFADSSTTHPVTHSQSQAPDVGGEHVHHHVHETVQPYIQRDTVVPEVVHTTKPVHEVHHAQAEHHGMSTLPTKTLAEFEKLGGKVTGGSQRHEQYEGDPRPYNPEMQLGRSGADQNPQSHDGLHDTHGTGMSHFTFPTRGNTHGTDGAFHDRTAGEVRGHNDNIDAGTGTTGAVGTTGTTGTSGTTGTATNVSGADYSTGIGNTSRDLESTGTALGGRTEGNTASRAAEAATSHDSSGVGGSHSGITTGAATGAAVGTVAGAATREHEHDHSSSTAADTTGTSGAGVQSDSRGLEHSRGDTSTGGGITHHDQSRTDTTSSTNDTNAATTKDTGSGGKDNGSGVAGSSDVQTPSQGKDPSLVESNVKGGQWKGEGVDGSHSAVFGLTPDGHKHDDTASGVSKLKAAHSKEPSNTDARGENSAEDTGSRAPAGGAVAEQMHDPKVAEKGHGGPAVSDTGSAKPGAGAPGGEQGLGQVRPEEHGTEGKVADKLDPNTDADKDGKAGVMD